MRLASTVQTSRRPIRFLPRELLEPNLKPISTSPGRGSHSAKNMLERRITAPDGPIVVKVNTALPPVLVTVTGLVLPKEQVGAGLTTGAILHESVTVPVYPLAGTTLTVAEAELPGLTEVGLAVPAESE
jgi:hypothetical protein